MPLLILSASLIIIFAVVLIPSCFYESKQESDYYDFIPVEYK